MTRHLSRLFIPLLLATACADQGTEPIAPPVTQLVLDAPAIALGDLTPVTLHVVVDGSSRVARADEFTVVSSNPSIIGVTAGGLLEARAEGNATVTVTFVADPTKSASRQVTVTRAEFVSLRLVQPVAMIPGDSAAISLSGITRGGAIIAAPVGVALSSRTTALQVVNASLVVARDTGVVWLVARAPDGAIDSVRMVLSFGAATALALSPRNAVLNVGDTARITPTLRDRRANLLGSSGVQYRSTNASIASVGVSGAVVGRQGGNVSIIASAGVLADTMLVVVNTSAAPPVTPPPPPPPPPPSQPSPPLPAAGGSVTPPGAYVQVRLTGNPTAAVVAAFTSAAARLNAILRSTGGVYPVPLSLSPGACSPNQPAISETVEGLLITAAVIPIDGPGSILGYAGPCLVRYGARGLPAIGTMAFDEDDMAAMAASGLLNGVVLHEMVHVLGIGTLWGPGWQGWVADPNGPDPRFTGVIGVAGYSAMGANDASNGIPVENTGGSGTRGGHWRETIFQTELMTGWAGGAMAMSRITVGALADLGYDVDIVRADSYTLPGILSGIREQGVEIVDLIVQPIGQVDSGGQIRPRPR
ncbi:MAG: leishmanolysin-related zinc metalloendopeptidase [Gemmatimonadales bacterium]